MAYEEKVAERVRAALGARRGIEERKMFGGLAFLSRGHMFLGIQDDTLMARVGPDAHERALSRSHVRVMDFTGRPMKGYVYVDAPGFARAADLDRWVEQTLSFVGGLPAKAPKEKQTKGPNPKRR